VRNEIGVRASQNSLGARAGAPRANRRRRVTRGPILRMPDRARLRALASRAMPSMVVLTASLVVAGILFGVYLWFTSAEVFAIRRDGIAVEGNRRLDAAEVVALLELGDDDNIFRTDMDDLSARLEAHPWIASASVQRELPDSLSITLEEYETAAAVELGGLYLVNHRGAPFKRASLREGDLDDVIVITGLSREAYLRDPPAAEKQIREALAVVQAYWTNPQRPRLGEVHLSARRGFTLTTYESAIAIHLGPVRGDQLESRLSTFDSAWASLDDTQLAAVRSFRIADRTPSDRVTIAFAGN
jgi:cell division protein FtsQ